MADLKNFMKPGAKGGLKTQKQVAPIGTPARIPEKFGYLRGLAEEIGYETGLNLLRRPFQSAEEAPVSLLLEEPGKRLAEWEARNVASDYIATGASFFVPYFGQVSAGKGLLKGATKVLPQLAKTTQWLSEAEKAKGIMKPFLAESAYLAAAEPIKLGIAAGVAPDKVGEIALWDLAAQPAGLAATGLAKAGYKGVKALARSYAPWESASRQLKSMFQNFPVEGATQDKLKFLRANAASVSKEAAPWVEGHIKQLERQVLSEEAKGKYVGLLATSKEPNEVNKLFLLRAAEGLGRKLFSIHPTHGFASRAEADLALKESGLPDGWSSHVQFPRQLTAQSKAKGKAIQKTVVNNLEATHNGWFIGEETESGLYVMAKKTKGAPKGGDGDVWTVLKTADPDAIMGKDVLKLATDRQVQFSRAIRERRAAHPVEGMPADSFPGVASKLWKAFDSKVLAAVEKKGAEGFLANTAGAGVKSGLQTLKDKTPEIRGAGATILGGVRDLLVPAQREFAGKSHAERVRLVVARADGSGSREVQRHDVREARAEGGAESRRSHP